MLSTITGFASAHVVAYLHTSLLAGTAAPTDPPPADGGIDFDNGDVPEPVNNFVSNLTTTCLYIGASLSFIAFVLLALGTFVFNKKWGGRATMALIFAIIFIAPTDFFSKAQDVFNGLNG